MPLNTNAALLQLDPLAPLKLDLGSKKAASMERERLQLMREQFEEAKRQNSLDEEYRRIHEAGETTRAQMASDRAREQQQAQARAETVAQRRAAYDSMVKRLDTGDFEGMEADATRLNELGGLAERTGQDENGFPAWRLGLDAEQARADEAAQDQQAAPRGPNESAPESLDRLNALGYDTLGTRDSLASAEKGAAAPLSTESAFRQAQAATRAPDEAAPEAQAAPEPDEPAMWSPEELQRRDEADAAANYAEPSRSTPMAPPPALEPSIFQATGRPARPAAAPDVMGAVPKDVIDTGAMQAQRTQRLGPVMDNMVRSMPRAYQPNTRASADAALGMGLPADKTADQALKFNAPANAALASERQHEFDTEKAAAAAAPKPLTRMDIDSLAKGGEARAKEVYSNLGIDDTYTRSAAAGNMLSILQDDDPNNDQAIAFELPNMLGSKGAQSNKDLAVALGLDAMSTVDQLKERLHNIISGGYTEMRKESLIAIIENKMTKDDELVYQFLDGVDEAASRATDEDVRRGLLDYAAANVPKEYRDAHEKAKGEATPERRGTTTVNDAAPDAAPDAGGPSFGDDIRIPETSRIAYVHNNPGNLMFNGQEGAEQGEPKDGGGHWAKFPTVEAGFHALQAQVERDQDMTIRAFITKYAPPTDGNDTEKYIADAARELKADPDDTVAETDFYDMVRFIARRESSTELPYQYAKRDAELAKFEREHPAPAGADDVDAAPGTDDAELLGGIE